MSLSNTDSGMSRGELARRWAIIIALLLAIIVVSLRLSNEAGQNNAHRRKVSDEQYAARLAQYRGGQVVYREATEGDFAKLGYMDAQQHQVQSPSQCASHVAAYTQGCLQWLQDVSSESSAH